MEHVLIAENRKQGHIHISSMSGFFFKQYWPGLNTSLFNIVLHSGRKDKIRIITHESQIMGHRFDGIVFRTNDSSALDSLFYRVKHWRPPNREKSDEQNIFWHWSKEISVYGPKCYDHPLARIIIDELEAEKWWRERG